eukprot:51011-Hanusia_phi.AAC.1
MPGLQIGSCFLALQKLFGGFLAEINSLRRGGGGGEGGQRGRGKGEGAMPEGADMSKIFFGLLVGHS